MIWSEKPRIEVFNEDCMPALEKMRENEYSLAICDPPYGINRDKQNKTICKNSKHNRKQLINGNWDNRPNLKYFEMLELISCNQIVWGANYFVGQLSSPSKGWIIVPQNNLHPIQFDYMKLIQAFRNILNWVYCPNSHLLIVSCYV